MRPFSSTRGRLPNLGARQLKLRPVRAEVITNRRGHRAPFPRRTGNQCRLVNNHIVRQYHKLVRRGRPEPIGRHATCSNALGFTTKGPTHLRVHRPPGSGPKGRLGTFYTIPFPLVHGGGILWRHRVAGRIHVLGGSSSTNNTGPVTKFLDNHLFSTRVCTTTVQRHGGAHSSRGHYLSKAKVTLGSGGFPALRQGKCQSRGRPTIFIPYVAFQRIIRSRGTTFSIPRRGNTTPSL